MWEEREWFPFGEKGKRVREIERENSWKGFGARVKILSSFFFGYLQILGGSYFLILD